MAKKYKYESPHEWLSEKVTQAYQSGNSSYLAGLLNDIIPKLDGDTIQDIFQDEMDGDGYFDEITE
jgi:hypothetical protein